MQVGPDLLYAQSDPTPAAAQFYKVLERDPRTTGPPSPRRSGAERPSRFAGARLKEARAISNRRAHPPIG